MNLEELIEFVASLSGDECDKLISFISDMANSEAE